MPSLTITNQHPQHQSARHVSATLAVIDPKIEQRLKVVDCHKPSQFAMDKDGASEAPFLFVTVR
ncbi:hypothetical protein CDO27_17710 [Sinorhizobium meliloti]|nr:hypothetical protein CDO27_17710 [Sinorhizobium meliloti]